MKPETLGKLIFIFAVILTVIGLIFIYTGSYFFCVSRGNSPYYLLMKQIISLFIALIAWYFTYKLFDYKKLKEKRWLWSIYGATLFILIFVLIFGVEVNGARSWIRIGGFSLQPAEFAKVFIILFVAGYLERKWYEIENSYEVFIGFMILVFIPIFLILLEKDLGSAMIVFISVFAMIFITGFRLSYILIPFAIGSAMFFLAVITAPYRIARIKMLFNPLAYFKAPGKSDSYQLVQALVSFAKGGLTGVGIGQGQQKLAFLPLAFSDFIYAHIGEEGGFIVASFILILFFAILFTGLQIADRTDDKMGKFLSLGLTLYIFLEGMVHIGVNIGLVPTTGITLPFVSQGGSSLIAMYIAVGLLMSIAKNLPEKTRINFKEVQRGRYG
ncbi:FtsW/RodA/SpoVE family cell cycle protein [Desulfurobacterium atlanticum]|uniref:Probable peptidoglycan glycosyltransferase FtsW n=1 Tax=Desulfurobacterium atlanticum TaxID=240169 RepID=A0A238Z3I1_9BACT|nr:putative peptidoglycan glycosyltransferase FtsW [Desulfurobacterium atlanticum]SNR77936.1 cell division protein FtsW [Desulfurobacterium atlanticum]